MAQITTFNQAQREVAQRFVEAYVTAEGEEFAADLIIDGRKNHRFYITMPGDEGHSEYTYSGMKELIAEYETRGSAVNQIAALAGGMAAPSILSNEVAESATISAQVGDTDEDGDAVAVAGDDVVVDSDATGGEPAPTDDEEGEGEGVDGVLFTGGAELPDLEGGVDGGDAGVARSASTDVAGADGSDIPGDGDGAGEVRGDVEATTEGGLAGNGASGGATPDGDMDSGGDSDSDSEGVGDGAAEVSGDGGDSGEEQEDGAAGGGDEPGEGDTGEPGDDGSGEVPGGAEGDGAGAQDDEVPEPGGEGEDAGDSEGGSSEEEIGGEVDGNSKEGETEGDTEDGGVDSLPSGGDDEGAGVDAGADREGDPSGEADKPGGDEGEDDTPKEEKLKEKVQQQNKKPKKSHAISSLIAAMLKHSDAGSQGKLALAEDLYDLDRISKEEGLNRNEQLEVAQSFFESKGRKFPDKTARSKLKAVWETWFANNGYDLSQELTSERLVDAHGVPKTTKPDSDELLPMPLASQDYNTLYAARNLVEDGEDEHNATLLAMINTFSYKTISKIAPHLDYETMTPQFDEWLKIQDPVQRENTAQSWADAKKGVVASDYKSISVLASTYEGFMGMIPRMTELAIEAGVHTPVEGKESSVSKAFVLDMLIATWEEFTDADKVLFIKLHHGSISAEEYEMLTGKTMDIEVEGIPTD